jgi:D-aspartate ligase
MDKFDIEVRKHKFILFCVDFYNPLGILRSLGEVGITPVTVILNDRKIFLLNHSKFLKEYTLVDSIEEGYNLILEKYGSEEFRPFIISCDDKIESYYDNHYEEMKDKFYFFHGRQQGIINYYMNKDNINKIAVECGFRIPQAEVLQRGEYPKHLQYPVITKTIASTVGGWKNDVFICNTKEELSDAYTKIKAPLLIVEEYIRKKTEFCFDAFCINNGEDVCIPFVEDYIRVPYDSYGLYMNVIPFQDDEMKAKVEKILRTIGYTGIFEVEFMVGPNDEVYFLEVNFRNSGWGHIVTYGGVNMPYLWAKSTLAGHLCIEGLNIREPFTAMVEPTDFKLSVLRDKQVTFFQWLKDLRNCDYLIYYQKNDKLPAFYKLMHDMTGIIKRKFRIK